MKYFLSALCAGMLVFAGYANASPEPAAMILGDYNIITIQEHSTKQRQPALEDPPNLRPTLYTFLRIGLANPFRCSRTTWMQMRY